MRNLPILSEIFMALWPIGVIGLFYREITKITKKLAYSPSLLTVLLNIHDSTQAHHKMMERFGWQVAVAYHSAQNFYAKLQQKSQTFPNFIQIY